METAAPTDAGSLKKKRNRAHKKTKPDATKVAAHCGTINTAQINAVEKENNPPTHTSLTITAIESDQRPGIEAEAPELSRKPSRRRKRKTKNDKKEPQLELQSITVEDLFPPGKISTQTVCQTQPQTLETVPESVSISRNPIIDKTKFVGIIDIRPSELFPVAKEPATFVQNLTFDEIFPGPEFFRFDAGGTIPGKLIAFAESHGINPLVFEAQPAKHTIEYIQQGLHDISTEQLFPNCLSIGLKTPSDPSQIACQPIEQPAAMSARPAATAPGAKSDKTREDILAEREAKKAAKLAAKTKSKDKDAPAQETQKRTPAPSTNAKEQRPAKQKAEPSPAAVLKKSSTDASICEKMKDLHISEGSAIGADNIVSDQIKTKELTKAERKALFEAKNPSLVANAPEGAKPVKPTLTKAERRAIQDAQRAAKADAQQANKRDTVPAAGKQEPKKVPKVATEPAKSKAPANKTVPTGGVGVTGIGGAPPRKHIVNLFNHLHQPKFAATEIVNSPTLHPAVTKLGIQYAKGAVVGSKARCLALLKVLNQLIQDYETPAEKEFGRSFEEMLNVSANHLQRCRPFSVSMTNALRHVKMYARQLDGKVSVSEQKECLLESIESYIRDQIEKAEEAICCSVQDKICDGDVILTYGCSSLIKHILEEAIRRKKTFRVIIVNARPRQEENAMLEELVQLGVKCMCVLINAVSYVMPEVTKVLLGAHALLANGSVMSRVGTAQIALVAKSYNVPVLVCCETHKFTERVQTDAFVYNEIGNPNELVLAPRTRDLPEAKPMLADWETITSLTILNLHYDVTPPELVTAVVTEVAILPCTSVPVILRIKPSDVAY
ncbi:translation initiation factor eIF-2B subunit delta [Anopheles marshallii]|uniref:translation initiation factor eIF-2B subunit delta n=1 Tax=Anopheles marshallii TaxID=1521116 RepID=UPI00237AB54B|nr:translation initiation factor eIF-2B subunit delta [Anopheles marshallii]